MHIHTHPIRIFTTNTLTNILYVSGICDDTRNGINLSSESAIEPLTINPRDPYTATIQYYIVRLYHKPSFNPPIKSPYRKH